MAVLGNAEMTSYQPYYQAYLLTFGYDDDDPPPSVHFEYISWISGRHQEFRKLHSIPLDCPYSREQMAQFGEFIQPERKGE